MEQPSDRTEVRGRISSGGLVRSWVPAWAAAGLTRALDRASGLAGVREVYDGACRVIDEQGKGFCDAVLDAMEMAVRVDRGDLERIPKKGPLVVVANHPYGGIEGLVLGSLMGRVRSDVKVVANEMLGVLREFRGDMVALDVFGGAGAAKKNTAGLREAMRHLKAGGCLIVFPAGEVSHFRWRERRVTDSAWQRGVAMLVRRTGSAVLPVYVPGGNGLMFNLAGLVHPRLRTALLPRATVSRRGTTMEVRVGGAVPAKRLEELAEADLGEATEKSTDESIDAAILEYLRRRVYMLSHREERAAGPAKPDAAPADAMPIISETPSADLAREVEALPEEALLVDGADYRAYVARPRQIPHVLREIGRLREVTFREVGEGTGKPLDLDDFDQHYLHLFIWHRHDRRVVGAYRLGRVDLILRAKGRKGLYTSTLFDYPDRLLHRLGGGGGNAQGGALEMGRSFVRKEYQRSHQPLLMLWKAIGAFVVRNPRYHTLFGPVSISASYARVSRHLIVRALSMTGLRADDADMVRARAPFKLRRYNGLDSASIHRLIRVDDDLSDTIDDVSDLIGDIEPDRKGIPVLLTQYLKLGARILSFNVDKDFGGCLDALVQVDLRKTDRKLLARYCGKEGVESFLKANGVATETVRK